MNDGELRINNQNISLPSKIPLEIPEKKLPVLLQELPLADTTVESKELNSNTTTVIKDENQELLEELDKLSLTTEEEINNQINDMLNNVEIVDANLTMEDIILQYPLLALKLTGAGSDFLSFILPSEVLELPFIATSFDVVNQTAGLGKIFISATNNGAGLLAAICKGRMIKNAKMVLEKVKSEIKVKEAASELNPEDLAKIQKSLQKWETNIQIQSKKLAREKAVLGVSTTFTTLRIGMTVLKYIPIASASVLKAFSTITSVVSNTISTVESGVVFSANANKLRDFKAWEQNYQKWQKKHTPVVVPEIHRKKGADFGTGPTTTTSSSSPSNPLSTLVQTAPVNDLVQVSESLFDKRKMIFDDKTARLESEFDSVEPKILETNRAVYKQSIAIVFNNLGNPSTPLSVIEESFNALKLSNDDPDTKALNEDFQNYQRMINAARPSEIQMAQKDLAKEFDKWSKNDENVSKQFDHWYAQQSSKQESRKELIHTYIDHQETLEFTTKNAAMELIQQKNILEKKFFKFNLIASGLTYYAFLACLAVTVGLLIAAVATTPLGGLAIVLLGLSMIPVAMSLGFLIASVLFGLKEKPKTTKAMLIGLNTKITWNRIKKAVGTYQHTKKVKKMKELARVLRQLHTPNLDKSDPTYIKALDDYQKAKAEFKKSETNVDEWNKNLQKCLSERDEKAWEDFTLHAGLIISKDPKKFDSLQAFSHALTECDLGLISDETRYIMETQLGMKLELLQSQMKKNPEAFKSAFKLYAFLSEGGLLNYIYAQEINMKAKIIPST